jgi:hypothetical protein
MEFAGKVILIEENKAAGVIEDKHGERYPFTIFACAGQELPPINSIVLFTTANAAGFEIAETVKLCHLQLAS